MTSLQVQSVSTAIEPVPARFRRASATITSHTIVDFFSFVVISLMPLLAARLDLSKPEKAMVIGLGAVASGLIQPLVAVLSDRHNTRILGTLGMLVAVVAVSCIGLVQNYWQLLLVQAVAASGIGAFHPVAAAAIGSLAGKQRTRFVATFFLAGMVGGVLGNVLAPQYVGFMSQAAGEHNVARGLRSLLWLMIPGALGVVMLSWAIHGVSHRAHDAIENHARLSAAERAARWRAVILLYVGNVIRFCTNMALVYLIVEWTTQLAAERHAGESVDRLGMIASEINGPMQAAQQVGMGFGGITLGMVLSARYEKAAFLVFPLIGAGAITLIPEVESLPESWVLPVAFVITALAGIGFGSVVPVSIAAAQRLLPHRTSLASGLMMGGAWALAFLGPHFAGLIHTHVGLRAAFLATAALLASAGVLALALPGRLMRQTSDE